jgi:hypothetical protein
VVAGELWTRTEVRRSLMATGMTKLKCMELYNTRVLKNRSA